jgi:uridylate kinase
MTDSIKHSRAIVKLSGEVLMGSKPYGIDPPEIARVAGEIALAAQAGAQIGVVIGGGNIFRGVAPASEGMDRAQADYIGMLATMMNALALADAFKSTGIQARVLSALPMDAVAERYSRGTAIGHLERGRVAIFAAGTGNPFFSTDTAAALRAAEIGASVILKAGRADGLRLRDERDFPDEPRISSISFADASKAGLKVIDAAAFALCREQKIPLRVVSIRKQGAILRALQGGDEGTLVVAA